MHKIAVVTTTRAEYGVLRRLLRLLEQDSRIELFLYVTGTHLEQAYGYTISEIEEDQIKIFKKIKICAKGETQQDIAKTMAQAQTRFTNEFLKNMPDLLVVVGDRYELLSICTSAVMLRIPIAHISGGEVTSGAVDDVIRNCITKMSYLHFPACEEYARRVIQMGENPERVFNFGDIGVDTVLHMDFLSKEKLQNELCINLMRPYAMVTFHPVTMEKDSVNQLKSLLSAIEEENELIYVFTKANADIGGAFINQVLQEFCEIHENCYLFDSLGSRKYLSMLAGCKVVIGNSSSGIYEAPAFRIPTINIGNRQNGRVKAKSIVDCNPNKEEIVKAIKMVQSNSFTKKLKNMKIPFEGGKTAEKILEKIVQVVENKINLQKGFYDIYFKTDIEK